MSFKQGDKVRVVDGSEAHNDIGVVDWVQADGIILVDLGECIWPVTEREIRHVEERKVRNENYKRRTIRGNRLQRIQAGQRQAVARLQGYVWRH